MRIKLSLLLFIKSFIIIHYATAFFCEAAYRDFFNELIVDQTLDGEAVYTFGFYNTILHEQQPINAKSTGYHACPVVWYDSIEEGVVFTSTFEADVEDANNGNGFGLVKRNNDGSYTGTLWPQNYDVDGKIKNIWKTTYYYQIIAGRQAGTIYKIHTIDVEMPLPHEMNQHGGEIFFAGHCIPGSRLFIVLGRDESITPRPNGKSGDYQLYMINLNYLDTPKSAHFRIPLGSVQKDGFRPCFLPSNSLNTLGNTHSGGRSVGRTGIIYFDTDPVQPGHTILTLYTITYEEIDTPKCSVTPFDILDSKNYRLEADDDYGIFEPHDIDKIPEEKFTHIKPHPTNPNEVFFVDYMGFGFYYPSHEAYAHEMHVIADIRQAPVDLIKNTTLYFEKPGENLTGHASYSADGTWIYETRASAAINDSTRKRGLFRVRTTQIQNGSAEWQQLWDAPDDTSYGYHQDHTVDDMFSVVDFYAGPDTNRFCYIYLVNNGTGEGHKKCAFRSDVSYEGIGLYGTSVFDAHPNFSYSGDFIAFTYITSISDVKISCLGLICSRIRPAGAVSLPLEAQKQHFGSLSPFFDRTLSPDSQPEKVFLYNVQGKIIRPAPPPKGLYIMRKGNAIQRIFCLHNSRTAYLYGE